jgi:SOS-response transcriptional repressor LexA
MSPRAKLILEFIEAYIRRFKKGPTYEVIRKAMGLKSKSNVHRIVRNLERDGYLVVRKKKFNGIGLSDNEIARL